MFFLPTSEFHCEFGEDEEECNANGTNEEIIAGIRAECNSTGLHVMCPQTFICISNNWLWYERNSNFIQPNRT